jgi:hypothetical protein
MSYVSVEENQQLPVQPTLLQFALFILTAAVLTASKHNFLNPQILTATILTVQIIVVIIHTTC